MFSNVTVVTMTTYLGEQLVFVNWFVSLMQGTNYTVASMTQHILIYCYVTGFLTTEGATKQTGIV